MALSYRFYFLLIACSSLLSSTSDGKNDDDWTFPSGFLIGTATSSYQIEGAWNISDKGENVWDHYTHTQPNRILNRDNGDVACNSYYKYKEDVALLKAIGVDHYRFSLSWSRILPTGYPNVISKTGVKYYNDLLDELEKNHIIPFVTIYHWDHPQIFQDMGGWTNEAMIDFFGDYARVVFKEFGHRVKMFVTVNEPNVVCENEYYTGDYAPGLRIGKHAEYLCTHNIIKAHAKAYHIYNKEFRGEQKGKIGIVLDCYQFYSKFKKDNVSADVAFQYQCGRYGGPIFSRTGDYPSVIKERISANSKYEGLVRSRLPVFSKKWIGYIKGSADFLGLNHYSSKLVEPAPKPNDTIYLNDVGLVYSYDPKWPSTPIETIKIVPDGFRDVLRKIKDEFGNPVVYVTENGLSDNDSFQDKLRLKYLSSYMKAMLTAIKRYGCNVKGYTVWSLLDNFEWERGYSAKYGIVDVDFNSPNRTRTAKLSAFWLKRVLQYRKIDFESIEPFIV